MASRWSSSAAGRASFEAHREKAQLATILAEGPGHELDPNSASLASDLFGCIRGSTWRICCHGNPDHADWTYIADTHWPVVFNRPACRSIFHGAVLRVYGGGHFARLADQTGISARAGMRLQPDRGGVAGLNLGSYVASLAAAALFGCGLGQVLSATNLGVAEVAKARRVAALSILNLMWGMGAIASSPLGMLAGRRGATALLLCAVAIGALLTALILAGMNLQPGTTEDDGQPGPTRSENISTRSTVSLAALFFPYVGSESSVAGWVASLTKRTNPDSGDLWALAPMFFWGALFAGRALVPLVPLRRRERTMLASGLIVAAAGICLLLEARTFASVAICVTAVGLGLAAIYPILVAWLVKAFGERSRRIGAVMFALAGMGELRCPGSWDYGRQEREAWGLVC